MQSLYMLNMVRWPWGRLNCKTMTSLEPSKGNCAHELESSAAFTNMTDLLVALSVRCEDGYIVCHLEFTFMLPNVSIYAASVATTMTISRKLSCSQVTNA